MRRAVLVSTAFLCATACSPGAKVTANVVAGTALGTNGSGLSERRDGLLASTSATSLLSLKYGIKTIQLCDDVQRSGSGYSNATGCAYIFRNANIPDEQEFYRDYLVSSALADTTPGRYVDLLTPEGRAALKDPPGPVPAGTYRYGLINFLRPIRITAEFPVLGGQAGEVVRTRATTGTERADFEPTFPLERALVGDTRSSAPAEETTYMLNNGGALFAFASPFVLTDADISAGDITMDLVFNPANFGQVVDGPQGGCGADARTTLCDPANNLSFEMPFVRMSPVPRKAGEQTRKEVYLVDFETGASASQLRVELYYNAADPQKAVRGVDVALVYLPTATAPANKNVDGSMLEQTGSLADGTATVTLKDYAGAPALSGILRGQSGTATFNCATPSGDVCPSIGSTAQRPYTFVEDVLVSAD
ncbi:MAG: hypothetical protein FJ086_03450 [Deltaproteobacteria bacterium]|nr:hypothetical protein [Deltaproteobacteria bacterium]